MLLNLCSTEHLYGLHAVNEILISKSISNVPHYVCVQSTSTKQHSICMVQLQATINSFGILFVNAYLEFVT